MLLQLPRQRHVPFFDGAEQLPQSLCIGSARLADRPRVLLRNSVIKAFRVSEWPLRLPLFASKSRQTAPLPQKSLDQVPGPAALSLCGSQQATAGIESKLYMGAISTTSVSKLRVATKAMHIVESVNVLKVAGGSTIFVDTLHLDCALRFLPALFVVV